MQACANYACPLRFIPLISTGFGGFSISFQSFLMFSWSVVGSAPPRPRRLAEWFESMDDFQPNAGSPSVLVA